MNLDDSKDPHMAWENAKQNIKISARDSLGLYEWKQHKPWFDEEGSKFLDQRKQAKIQWLQGPNQSNAYNLNNVICEARRHFRDKQREYVRGNLNQTVRSRTSENCAKATTTLRRVPSTEVIEERLRRVTWLQTPTVFWLGGGIVSLSY
jgi:hypothetical protein